MAHELQSVVRCGTGRAFDKLTAMEDVLQSRKRHLSWSSDGSTDSSNSSVGLESRDIGIFYHWDDLQAAEITRFIPPQLSYHSPMSVPCGEHKFKGLVAIGRRVKLFVFVITSRFLRHGHYKEYECLLQRRLCDVSNTLLLIDSKNRRALPLHWNHYRQHELDLTSVQSSSVAKILAEYDNVLVNSAKKPRIAQQPVIVLSSVMCYVRSKLRSGKIDTLSDTIFGHELFTDDMLREALRYLRSPDILQHVQDGDELYAELRDDGKRRSLIKSILDLAWRLPLDIPFKFVCDDIDIIPRQESLASSILSQLLPSTNWTNRLQKYVSINLRLSREGPVNTQSDSNQLTTSDGNDGEASMETNNGVPAEDTILDTQVKPLFPKPNEIQGKDKRGRCRVDSQKEMGVVTPTLQTIKEEERAIRHYVVQNLPTNWTKQTMKTFLGMNHVEAIRFARLSGARRKTRSFKISTRDDITTLRKISSWPAGARVGRFFFGRRR